MLAHQFIVLYPHLKQGSRINPFVFDLCFSPTLGTSGVSSGHIYTLHKHVSFIGKFNLDD